jgi:hypothetical protein
MRGCPRLSLLILVAETPVIRGKLLSVFST